MRKLTALTATVTVAAALVLAGPAPADRRPDRPVVIRALAVPQFFDATSACPAFSAKEQASIGWFEFCLETVAFDASGGVNATGSAIFHLPGGTIATTLSLVEVATSAGSVVQTDTGTIFRGTGRYRGATGTLSGGGPISFDGSENHPNLTLTLTLGRGRGLPLNGVDSATARIVGRSGSVVQTADTGTGRATYLGAFTLNAGETIDLATGAVTNGFFTFTAANGDSISGTYSGMAVPDLTDYLVSGPITGGTGRFAGAKGFLVWRGGFDPTAFTGSDVLTGWISSAAPPDDDDGGE